ncbi:MAG: hypothetical protein KDH84_17575 [Calditrichaeota bacterium]|nr:hypothetical protein [Calditrichota bacterium]
MTEVVLGLDLVKLQLLAAEGHPLPLRQEDLSPRGHALECRINAEDVYNNFVPSTGQVTHLKHPEGPGVRVDSGITAFSEISRFYDPMAAKLITWAETRDEAIERMKRALLEFQIEGIKTTIPFCLAVLDHPEFRSGKFTTKFVEQYWDSLKAAGSADADLLEVIAAAVAYHQDQAGAATRAEVNHAPGRAEISPWKMRALQDMRRSK